MSKAVLMQGNEAAVEGAIAAGMRFFAGYPITPSTEIAEGCARRLPQEGGKFIQMEDELASIAAVLGASAAGMKAMTATSGPGFSLMQENIGYGAMAEIPCVIVDVQRAGPSTGLPTSPSQADYMQARWGTHGDHPVIALSPSSVRETYTLIIRAFNLAFHDGANKQCYFVPEGKYVPVMKPFGHGERYNITGLAHDQSGFPTNSSQIAGKLCQRLMDKVEKNVDHICRVEEYAMDDAETAVVCFGGGARAVMEAVLQARAEGRKVGMFRPITVWPFPEKALEARLPQLKRILMVEHNHGQMLLEVQRVAGNEKPVDFLGRIDGTVITPEEILNKLAEMEGEHHAQ